MEIEEIEKQYEEPRITTYTEKEYCELVGPVCTGPSSLSIVLVKPD